MPSTDKDWARSYARQALSDLNVREILIQANAHKCHRLHFLQMAAEKACKAHLIMANGHEKVRKTHAYVGGDAEAHMAANRKATDSEKGKEMSDPFSALYPNIAAWVEDGWVEILKPLEPALDHCSNSSDISPPSQANTDCFEMTK